MNEEGITSANHSQTAAREPVTAAIVRRWWLLGVAAAAQIATLASLRASSLAHVRRGTRRLRRPARLLVRESSGSIAWAIEATGRRLGRFSSCLARAVVAEMMLDPAEGPVHFWIGVRHTSAGELQAHAWITTGDRVVVGAPADNYEPIVRWANAVE